jgi:catechol 2,3-dioxygenase
VEWEKVHMVTEPLDVKDMLTQNPYEMWEGLPPNTSVGHVHLHVSNLDRSRWFYHDVLAFIILLLILVLIFLLLIVTITI